ncbi:MAG: hypothetical protein M3389_01900 [Actinomycetota bacterium]|nr:hypothetical protein [Actinomycetota bacterium]
MVREAAAGVVRDGRARLGEGEHAEGGRHLALTPANPAACALTVWPDYPTLCLGGDEGSCTELFGDEATRLRELRDLVEAVIAGRFSWRRRQVRRRFLFLRFGPTTQFVGTFDTPGGPWAFTREGLEPAGRAEHRTYEPY